MSVIYLWGESTIFVMPLFMVHACERNSICFPRQRMITNVGRYSSYTAPPNSRQISGIFTKSRAIWNRTTVCRKWHMSHHFSSTVCDGWYLELIKSVKFSFTAWQNIAGCSYMAQCCGGRMHTTAAFSRTWLLGMQLCVSSTYRLDTAIILPKANFLVVP